MSRLLSILGTESERRQGDIVFIHGLDGDAVTTWQFNKRPEFFWPEWLGQDLGDWGVWTLDYDAASIAWKARAMPLSDRATNALALFEAYGLGRRPLVLIGHSLGGLLIKQILRQALDYAQPEWKEIAKSVRGLIFLATPHSGSNLATWLQYLGLLLRTNDTIRDLQAHDSHLRDLNLWFRNNVNQSGVKCQVYFEKLRTANMLVVDETSADPGIQGVIPIPVDANHINICKLESRNDLIYVSTKRFVLSCVQKESPTATPPQRLVDYLYVDTARVASYCEQFGISMENKHRAIQAVVASLKHLSPPNAGSNDIHRGPVFVFQRLKARRAYFSRKSAGLQIDGGDLAMWVAENLTLIENAPREVSNNVDSFTGYSTFAMLMHELGERGDQMGTGFVPPIAFEEELVSLAPDFYDKLRAQDVEQRTATLASEIKKLYPNLTGYPTWYDYDAKTEVRMDLDFNEDYFWVTVDGDHRATNLRISHLAETPIGRSFRRDPVAFLERHNAKIAPEREVDVCFQIRSEGGDGGVVGYPLFIAAAPSGLL